MEAQSIASGGALRGESKAEPTASRTLSRRADIARRDATGRRLLALADLFAVALAVSVSTLAGHTAFHPLTVLVLAPLVVLTSKAMGLYGRDEVLVHRTTLDEVPKLVQLATTFAFLGWLMGASVGHASFGRMEAVAIWGSFLLAAVLVRYLARRLTDALSPDERCVVLGSTASARGLGEMFERDRIGAVVVANIQMAQVEDLSIDDLRRVVDGMGAHRLVLTADSADTQSTLDLIRAAKIVGVQVSLMPRLLEVIGSQVQFDHVGGALMLGVRTSRLSRSDRLLKRVLDLTVASVLLVVSAPVLALTALAIRLDSRGPVFYRQKRVGVRGRHFEIVKFRTMEHDTHHMRDELAGLNEADGLFKIADDPRITRVGRLLRRTSLDELPQLINVLRGEMSLVGPRPLVLDEDALIMGFDRHRLDLTPGMTGHWQILGSSRIPLHEMARIDYLYVAGWTLWTDMKLLLRTLPYVLSRRGM